MFFFCVNYDFELLFFQKQILEVMVVRRFSMTKLNMMSIMTEWKMPLSSLDLRFIIKNDLDSNKVEVWIFPSGHKTSIGRLWDVPITSSRPRPHGTQYGRCFYGTSKGRPI